MVALVLLLVLAVYVSLAVVIAKAVPGRLVKALILAVFMLIPTWDIIPSWLYFKHLCDTQAEIKVLKTVKAGQEYFLANGQPDGKKLIEQYAESFRFDEEFLPIFRIAKRESAIHNKQTGELLGTATDFGWRG